MAFEHYMGWSRAQLQLNLNEHVSESELLKFHFCIKDLKTQKPIQYILGFGEFYGMKLKVDASVLIPRPETEELVHLIARENTLSQPHILDIGTGSGAIALALKQELPKAVVVGMDVSAHAIEIAEQNAASEESHVEFRQADILQSEWGWCTEKYDVIVSNPPYIAHNEKHTMESNVLDFEPHLALFVDDEDPLLFYNVIAEFALQKLNPNGRLYFEINQQFGQEIFYNLERLGFKGVEVVQDLNKNDRMIRAQV